MTILTADTEEGRGDLFVCNVCDIFEWLEWAASSAGEGDSDCVVGLRDKVILLCSSTWI